jgi:D-cysteine desulfhydrase family pyridoxal phosphate-dependent enzyme
VQGAAGLRAAIAALPCADLAAKPSPLQRVERFSRAIGVEVWLKRDDLLGPAMGGNKVRKLELLLGDALAQGTDCVITCGAAQSNHARLTAACARLVGLEPYLVLRSLAAPAQQGNLLLDRLLGASVQIEQERRSVDLYPAAERLAESLRAQGRRPYFIPVGGAVPLGDLAYAGALLELDEQARGVGLDPTTIFHASSSGGTQAGLSLGAAVLAGDGRHWRVRGVDVDGDPDGIRAHVTHLASDTVTLLEERAGYAAPDPTPHVDVLSGYAGEGYGIVSAAGREAIQLLAQTEGVFVDPVYSGKALSALIGEARAGRTPSGSPVVFWHTGGVPALFAYASDLVV